METTKLFGNKITPVCKYCQNARGKISLDEMVLCSKKGVVPAGYHCRHYIYDPLKREPKRQMEQKFNQSDFLLYSQSI